MQNIIKLLTVIALLSSFVFAGNTWDGGGSDDNWGTGDNWNDNSSPSPGTGNDLYFAGSTRLTPYNNYTAWDDWRDIYFSSGASSFTISGNSIDLYRKIENSSSNPQTASFSNIGMSADPVEFNPVNGDITLGGGGTIYNNGRQLIVYGDNGNTLTVDMIISGSGTVVINQNSTVVYKKVNTYSGSTYVNAGQLRFDQGSTVGGGTIYVGNTTGSAGASLYILDNNGGTTVDEVLNVRSGSSGAKTIGGLNSSGINTYSDTVTLNDDVTIDANNSGGTMAFSGIISGDYDTTLNGPGTVRLTALNTFGSTKTLFINNGTLELNRAFGDPLAVNEIKLGYQTDDVTLKLSSSSGLTVDNQINVRSTSGTKKILNSSGANTISSSVELDANLASTADSGSLTYSGTTFDLKDKVLTVDGSGNTTISAKLTDSTGTGDIVKNGSGMLTIGDSANDFSGTVTINAGTLSGAGKLSGSTTLKSSAIVHPNEDSEGTLSFGNGLTFESGSKYKWNISGSSVDTIGVTGGLVLPSSADTVEVIVTRDSAVNNTYTLISTTTGISGGDETAFYSTDDNVEFQINGNDVEIVVTPEPGMFIGLILAGLAMVRARS